jgi:hypothetical protein
MPIRSVKKDVDSSKRSINISGYDDLFDTHFTYFEVEQELETREGSVSCCVIL